MGKATLRFAQPTNPDYLIVTWAHLTTPNAEIGRQVYTSPHPQRSLTVENLDPVMHRFAFWQSSDGVSLDTFHLKMDIDCSVFETIVDAFDYVVNRGNNSGGTPGDGSYWEDPVAAGDTVTDERLTGTYFVERRGTGTLRPDEVTKNIGSFQVLNGAFEEGETLFAWVKIVVQQPGSSVPSSDYMDIVDITGSINFSSDHYRKFLNVTSSADVAVFSIGALSGITPTRILICTHEMTGRYFKIALSGADTTKFLGRTMASITLGKGEEIELMFTGSSMKVMRYEGDYRRLGQLIFGRVTGVSGIELNRIMLDGTEYFIADFPRLYNDFVNLLPAAQIKSFAQWEASSVIGGVTEYPNKGFFGVDIGTGKFKIPDLRDRFVRSLKLDVSADSSRFTDHPGGLQLDSVAAHTHIMEFKKGKSDPTESGTEDEYFRWLSSGGHNFGTRTQATSSSGSGQTLPRNIGFIPQIII